MYETIPAELKRLRQWVCWTGDKLPKDPHTGRSAKSNDSSTWSDFATACEAKIKYGFSGIGFMFAEPYFGVDLDDCIDNQDLIDEFVETLQSYTEYSTSGKGIHIICKGKLPEGARRRGKVEMYSERRYFIMTGKAYADYPINDCTEQIKVLHGKYLESKEPKVAPKVIEPLELTDQEVLEKARNCKTGTLFQLLYSGNWEGLYASQSEADLALCNQLAFWTQRNEAQIDRLFRTSGLMRDKWDKKRGSTTYGQTTVQKACVSCTEVYEPQAQVDDAEIAIKFFGRHRKPAGGGKVYDMTDSGNAQRLKDKFENHIRYSYTRKKWYYWTGKVWRLDDTGEIKKLADLVVDDLKKEAFDTEDEKEREIKLRFARRTANSSGKCNMITEAQHLQGIPVRVEEMDAFTNYLNCQNGVVNLKNGELIPHDQNFMMTKLCNCEYDNSDKKPERWLSFLDDVTNGDKELQRYLQKCIGYSLGGSTKEQCAFFLYGVGNNGKSTFIETIADMLGDYASNAQPETIMMNRNSGVGSDIARLKSARLVSTEEPTEGVRLNEGLVKQLTGGGKVTCRFLFGDEFEYTPEFKIWVATNHKPVIRGTDVGIWRRIRLIPFEVNIPPEKVDKMLKYKFRAEMPQILHWAVEGCIAWQQEGIEPPQCVIDATQEYKSEMDLLAAFADACVVIDYTADGVDANQLYAVYTKWAEANNEYIMTSRKFFIEIGKKLPDKKRVSRGVIYQNIRLTDYAKESFTKPVFKTYSANQFRY